MKKFEVSPRINKNVSSNLAKLSKESSRKQSADRLYRSEIEKKQESVPDDVIVDKTPVKSANGKAQ